MRIFIETQTHKLEAFRGDLSLTAEIYATVFETNNKLNLHLFGQTKTKNQFKQVIFFKRNRDETFSMLSLFMLECLRSLDGSRTGCLFNLVEERLVQY